MLRLIISIEVQITMQTTISKHLMLRLIRRNRRRSRSCCKISKHLMLRLILRMQELQKKLIDNFKTSYVTVNPEQSLCIQKLNSRFQNILCYG